MDITQIRQFLNLAEALNFTEAARLSGISQPSLTRSVKRLEDELGGALVYRDGKDSRLTQLGRDIQIELMHIIKSEERVRSLAQNSVHGRRETVTLGVSTTLSPIPISKFLNHVLKELPSVEIVVHPLSHGSGPDLVLSGQLDGCFLADGPETHKKLSVVELFQEVLMLGCSTTHRFAAMVEVPAKEMANENYIDRMDCEFRTVIIERLMDNEALMQPRLHLGREDLAQQMVVDGDAICIIPEYSATAADLVLKRVPEIDISRRVSFVAVAGLAYGLALKQIRTMAEEYDWQAILRALQQ